MHALCPHHAHLPKGNMVPVMRPWLSSTEHSPSNNPSVRKSQPSKWPNLFQEKSSQDMRTAIRQGIHLYQASPPTDILLIGNHILIPWLPNWATCNPLRSDEKWIVYLFTLLKPCPDIHVLNLWPMMTNGSFQKLFVCGLLNIADNCWLLALQGTFLNI